MRTRRGYEAIDLAERADVLLYDLEYRVEVTAAEARAAVEAGRDPQSFVLQNWPDSDEEAEQVILREFDKALKERRVSAARLVDIASLNGGLPIHPGAAELAAERLVEQGRLECSEEDGEPVYRLPRRFGFSESFLSRLRDAVCDDCASLRLDGAFHETCLLNLMDVLEAYTFTAADVEERPAGPGASANFMARAAAGRQWLAKTAAITREKWKNVLRPILETVEQKVPPRAADETAPGDGTVPGGSTPVSSTSAGSVSTRSQAESGAARISGAVVDGSAQTGVSAGVRGASGRPLVTKAELIRYLQGIEIIEEDGELRVLQDERERLLKRLEATEQDLQQAEKQRISLERQLSEMQRDMDILIQAIRIAKRHEAAPTQVVDAAFETDD